jgi:hypothetical protein
MENLVLTNTDGLRYDFVHMLPRPGTVTGHNRKVLSSVPASKYLEFGEYLTKETGGSESAVR